MVDQIDPGVPIESEKKAILDLLDELVHDLEDIKAKILEINQTLIGE